MNGEPCAWAACKNGDAVEEGGYLHCPMHLKWHRKLEAGEDAPPSPREREYLPCGTPAAARRHQRRGEPVCNACRRAEMVYNATRRTVKS